MRLSDVIRKSALRDSMRCFADLLGADEPAWRKLYEWHDHDWWYRLSVTERRMWQLFVAEAIGQMNKEQEPTSEEQP